jgi:hypothetical protein
MYVLVSVVSCIVLVVWLTNMHRISLQCLETLLGISFHKNAHFSQCLWVVEYYRPSRTVFFSWALKSQMVQNHESIADVTTVVLGLVSDTCYRNYWAGRRIAVRQNAHARPEIEHVPEHEIRMFGWVFWRKRSIIGNSFHVKKNQRFWALIMIFAFLSISEKVNSYSCVSVCVCVCV